MPFVDVPRGELGGRPQGLIGVGDAVVLLEARLEPEKDVDGLGDRGLHHVDLLETTREGVILLEDVTVLLVGGRADAADLAVGEHRLDQIGGVHDAARGGAGADHRVYLVDEQDRTGKLLELADDALQALLEIAAVLRAGDERAHVESEDGAVGEHLGHLTLDDQPRESLGDRRLADAGLADVQGVVLAATAEDLDGALDLELAADERIDPPFLRHAVEVARVLLECAPALALALGVGGGVVLLGGLLIGNLRQPVRDVIDDVEPRDALAVEEEHRVALLFAEDRHQHVADADLFLAARLHVEHGALQHPLEAERRLHLALLAFLETRRRLIDVIPEFLLQLREVGPAGPQHLTHLGRVEDRQQQVLDRQVLVTGFARLMERIVETVFELVG